VGVVAELPDQKQLWNSYGHAMGAAVGLELLMRIALINTAAQKLIKEERRDEESRNRAIAEVQGMTLGQTVRSFKESFPDFANDAQFCESIDNAVSSRNHLAHHFLEGNLLGLRSVEGVELATLGCLEVAEHFKSLENYVRSRCPVDYDEFFRLGEGKADEFVENHPLRDKLSAIKEGRLKPDARA
jgi:hypothetical protein